MFKNTVKRFKTLTKGRRSLNVKEGEVKTPDEAPGGIDDKFVELESVHELKQDVVMNQAALALDDMNRFGRQRRDDKEERTGFEECDRWPEEILNKMTALEQKFENRLEKLVDAVRNSSDRQTRDDRKTVKSEHIPPKGQFGENFESD